MCKTIVCLYCQTIMQILNQLHSIYRRALLFVIGPIYWTNPTSPLSWDCPPKEEPHWMLIFELLEFTRLEWHAAMEIFKTQSIILLCKSITLQSSWIINDCMFNRKRRGFILSKYGDVCTLSCQLHSLFSNSFIVFIRLYACIVISLAI